MCAESVNSCRGSALIEAAVTQVSRVVYGKEDVIRLALICLLARGHLLIEDLPGIGKTTLAQGLARTLGLDFARVQFTSDLLPGDILGVSVYDAASSGFVFHPGPIFTHLLLADEINRATPKTQSALLEAMEERQVSGEGVTRPLPDPFFVIATQNPVEHSGAYPLPDSQLDRFLFRVGLGYPGREQEMELLEAGDTKHFLPTLEPVFDPAAIAACRKEAESVTLSRALLEYVMDVVAHTRDSGLFKVGLSPRAGQGIVRAARARAWSEDRDFALPEDVQAVAGPVCAHRLRLAETNRQPGPAEFAELLSGVPIP